MSSATPASEYVDDQFEENDQSMFDSSVEEIDLFENSFTGKAADEDDDDETVDPSFIHLVSQGQDTREQPDLYAVLGVAKDASPGDIRAAYRRLSRLLHPDRHSVSNRNGDGPSSAIMIDAETAFGRVSTAYSILNDPDKRAVYDAFGHAGLNIPGWEIATCEKSAPELRLKYLLLKQKAESEKQLQLTQPNSEFTVGLDLTDLFDRYLEVSRWQRNRDSSSMLISCSLSVNSQEPSSERADPPRVTVSELSLAQSVTAGLTMRNSVSLAGQVSAHNGLGLGTWATVWRHYCGKRSLLSFTTVDTEISYGRGGRGLCSGVRLRRAFGSRLIGNIGLSLSSRPHRSLSDSGLFLVPGFSTGWHIQLLPRTHARVEWRWNTDPGLTSELTWSSLDEFYTARLSARVSGFGRAGIGIRLERVVHWSWLNPPRGSGAAENEQGNSKEDIPEWAKDDRTESKDPDSILMEQSNKQGRVFTSIDVNTTDLVELSVGAQCSLSEYSRLLGTLSFSFQRGVNVRLTMLRGTQTYTCSLFLSERPNFVASSYGLLVPMLLFTVVRSLVYEPYLNRKLDRAQRLRRVMLKDELMRRRREALATQSLMRESAKRVRITERSVGGLLLVRAVYGLLPTSDGRFVTSRVPAMDVGGPLTVDVTVPLQGLVERSQLRLPPGHWSDLQGFYDPCMGIFRTPSGVNAVRQLHVVYTFHGELHQVVVSEQQGLAMPMAKHKLEDASND